MNLGIPFHWAACNSDIKVINSSYPSIILNNRLKFLIEPRMPLGPEALSLGS